jgi:hypothetical protein
LPLPKGMGNRDKLSELSPAFGNSGGDLWFHIKSDCAEDAQKALGLIERRLKGILADGTLIVPGESGIATFEEFIDIFYKHISTINTTRNWA